MVALFILMRSQLRVGSPARAHLPSEVSDPIVTIETSKITFAPEEGSKKTASASKVLPSAAVSRVSTTAAFVTPFASLSYHVENKPFL